MENAERRDEYSYPSIIQAIWLIVFFFISTFIFGIFTSRPIGLTLGSLVTLAFAHLMQRTVGEQLSIGFRISLNWRIYLYVFSCSIAMLFTVILIILWTLTLIKDLPDINETMEYSLYDNIGTIITVVIISPIIEEILFRGIILKSFLQKYSPVKAILVSAVIFAFAHLQLAKLGNTMILGYFTGWLFYRTKSVIPGILCHITNNAIILLPLFLYFKISSPATISFGETPMNNLYFSVAIIVCIILFSLSFRLLKKSLDNSFPLDCNK